MTPASTLHCLVLRRTLAPASERLSLGAPAAATVMPQPTAGGSSRLWPLCPSTEQPPQGCSAPAPHMGIVAAVSISCGRLLLLLTYLMAKGLIRAE